MSNSRRKTSPLFRERISKTCSNISKELSEFNEIKTGSTQLEDRHKKLVKQLKKQLKQF